MSRNTGTFNFAANFEGLLKAPIDAKQLVGTYADLTTPATWNGSGSVWLYNGAMVVVGSDPTPTNNGIYWLCDANNYTMTCAWEKAGSGSGSGTLTGATNGLHLTNSGRTVALGGTLTGATFITDSLGKGIQYSADYSGTFNNNSLVTKKYVDIIASGLKPKAAVNIATTSPITLSGLTQTIDGIPVTSGMRILVKDQASSIANGIYSASTGTWNRTPDYNGVGVIGAVESGSYAWVLTGNTNGNTAWVLITPDPITVGVTPLNFALFAAVTDVIAGTGITVNMLGGVHVVSLNVPTQEVVNSALTGTTGSGIGTSGRNVCLTSGTIAILNDALTGTTGSGIGTSGRNVCLTTGTIAVLNSALTGTTGSGIGISGKNVCLTTGTIGVINSALTGATNGLSYSSRCVCLGGALTTTTDIYGAHDFTFGVTTPLTSFGAIASSDVDILISNGSAELSMHNNNAILRSRNVYVGLTGSTGPFINISGTTVEICGSVNLLTTPSAGSTSDSILVWNSTDKIVKKISGGSVLTSAITGATNGLTKVGQTVALGGNLTGNTCICTLTHCLSIGCSNIIGLSVDSNTISAFHCLNASNGSASVISNTGITLSNKTGSVSCSVILGANALVYGANYCSSFNNRTLVDKEYVDNKISGCSNILKVKVVNSTYYALRNDDLIAVSGISSNPIYLLNCPVCNYPVCGQRVTVVDICGNALGDPITINGNGKNINNGSVSTINTDYGSVTFVYNGIFWSAIAFVN